jgi:two-component system, NarL family, invasion response regulator UvrY
MKGKVNILLIEDHELVQWALRRLLKKSIPNAQIDSASDFVEGLSHLSKHQVDLVVLDIDVPGGNSPGMIDKVRQINPAVLILIHTGLNQKQHVAHYLKAGANGFVSKNDPVSTVIEAVLAVLSDKKFVSPIAENALVNYVLEFDNKGSGKALIFTPREKDVLLLLLKGRWTNEIAHELGLKATTVSQYKSKIFGKFGVTNVIDLVSEVQLRIPEIVR